MAKVRESKTWRAVCFQGPQADKVLTRSFDSVYMMGSNLGAGNYGVCQKALDRERNEKVAIKTISHKNGVDYADRKTISKEAMISLYLKHPSVVTTFEVYFVKEAKAPLNAFEEVRLVMEYCPGGSLRDRITKERKILEQPALFISQQMFSAIQYLHSVRICHRDLKPDNILMMSADPKSPMYNQIRIADFGLSDSNSSSYYRDSMSELVGSPEYCAPELATVALDIMEAAQEKREALKLPLYSAKVDCWSAGIIVYVMLGGVSPFAGGESKREIMVRVETNKILYDGPRWSRVSDDAKAFLTTVLQRDPRQRPTAAECMKHSWLASAWEKADIKALESTIVSSSVPSAA